MKTLVRWLAVLGCVALLAACGGSKPFAMADAPVFPGANELKPDDSHLAAVLQNNGTQANQMSQAAGVNSKLEQKGFSLPADASWDAVSKFYDDKLKAAGFTQGTQGGSAVNNMLNNALSATNQANDLFKTTIYSKAKQTLTIIMVTDPTSANQKILVLSLNSN